MNKPLDTEYAPFYKSYIDLIEEGDILKTLARQADYCAIYFDTFADRGDHRYAEGKWTVKQLIQHIIDTERVFAYRILRISRGDETPLAGFDENTYADAAPVDHLSIADLTSEFMAVRSATYTLLNSLVPDQWTMLGTASGTEVSVRAIAYIIAGHCAHHMAILEERYM
ncbi:MAG: DinB family protein [Bacteroidetes bacterium]|nr:MAG: DinB family protein [Bacteroidota bacterium]